MKFRTIKFGLGASVLALATVLSPVANADSSPALAGQSAADQAQLDGVDGNINSIQDRLKQLNQNIQRIEQEKVTVSQQVKQLGDDAARLLPELQAKDAAYRATETRVTEAVAIDYQSSRPDALTMLAGGESVSRTLDRATYFDSVERQLEHLAERAAKDREELAAQKRDLDTKRSNQELAVRELAALAVSQNQQKSEQQELLANQTNEAAYLADRIARAKSAEQQILKGGSALWGTYTDGASVKQGDVIGFEGSTGNSTGCHTHFSVIENGQWVDPQPFIDSGVFRRPDGSTTQGFGMTDWAKTGAYGGNIHNGVDFVQPCGAPVRAAKDGVVIRDNRTDGSGFGHYIMIRHAGGLLTLYGHLV